ncbi:MAG TPA: hypothetical protein VGE52_14365 [Pirellulales bacterium]
MARKSWFDDNNAPVIDKYAQEMTTFLDAMADGKITDSELADQEKRLIAAMKKAEPLLSDEQHAAVTDLLCEMAAFDLMQVLHSMEAARMDSTRLKSAFG